MIKSGRLNSTSKMHFCRLDVGTLVRRVGVKPTSCLRTYKHFSS